MRVIHLARKPTDTTTVAAVLEHGTAALDIGDCRIGSAQVFTHSRGSNQAFPKRPGERTAEESGRAQRQDQVDQTPRTGRWPSNLILQHLPGCECVGTRRVKASAPASGPTLWDGSTSNSRGRFNGIAATASHGDADGMESVDAWECKPGCPVAALDAQSGITKSCRSTVVHEAYQGDSMTKFLRGFSTPDNQYADTGGASRFFKQVKP